MKKHGLSPHQYAVDTLIYGSCSPSHVDDFSSKVSGCVNNVAGWMRLQLNPEKTELLDARPVGASIDYLPLLCDHRFDVPVSSVRDLGIFVDSDLATSR